VETAGDGAAGRTFILLNPAAGRDDPARLRRLIGRAFSARCVDFDMVETDHVGHATELAAQAALRGYRACCVVGGDGTLAEVATGLAGSNVPVALIPRGTGNQVAQNLGIPLSLKRAVDVAIHGRRAPLDLGRVGERAFALAAGAGYDAAVMAAATRQLKERFGFGAYVIATLREAMALEPSEFHIVADGHELRVSAVSVILANMGEIILPLLPIRLPLGPHHGPTWRDGRLDVVVLAPRNLAGFAAVLWRAARRRFGGDERLIHLQAAEITIDASPAVPVQVDGDPAGQTPIIARAIHHGVDILVP
jgi:YegS/Rv2252/BmrU family lipid kinase